MTSWSRSLVHAKIYSSNDAYVRLIQALPSILFILIRGRAYRSLTIVIAAPRDGCRRPSLVTRPYLRAPYPFLLT